MKLSFSEGDMGQLKRILKMYANLRGVKETILHREGEIKNIYSVL